MMMCLHRMYQYRYTYLWNFCYRYRYAVATYSVSTATRRLIIRCGRSTDVVDPLQRPLSLDGPVQYYLLPPVRSVR
jgi:hypothetical protein